MIISALGLVNPKDPRFNGDPAAAQAEARADAKRQLVEKVLALYVDGSSLDKNYRLIEQRLLSHPGSFIKTVLQEGAPVAGKDGLIAAEARAAIKVREVQKSINDMSREERIDFIRNNGDPKIAIVMAIRNADTAQALPAERSQLAENVVKERIKSFGFRVWSAEGDAKTGPNAQTADFQIQGEVKVKLLSARLAASGVTVTKTVLTSWTVKAIDRASGEEIYLNTVSPKGRSWATEDQALAEIGKLVGEEFSKNFFLQHFNFGAQTVSLNIAGLPDAASARLLLRELRGIRPVLDAQLVADSGRFQLRLAEGSAATDIVQDAVLRPLNTKLGQNCFALAGATSGVINVSFSSGCAEAAIRAKLETAPPAGLLNAPESRSKGLLKAGAVKA
jgi:serine/threonine-protein kinase